MAFLHTHSCECLKSELELYTVPPTQTTIENSQWIHYKPISSLTEITGPAAKKLSFNKRIMVRRHK